VKVFYYEKRGEVEGLSWQEKFMVDATHRTQTIFWHDMQQV
jgi:hypothetical protein